MSLREPPPHIRPPLGVGGAVGVMANMILFVLDLATDGLLAYVLWRQAQVNEGWTELFTWFIITLCLILVPLVTVNAFSLAWYFQTKHCLGAYSVLHKMGRVATINRVILHILLLGPLVRHVDILQYALRRHNEKKDVEMLSLRGSSSTILRRTPKGEGYAALQMAISRDSAMVDMMHSFLQDAPQLLFQVFLLYRRSELLAGTLQDSPYTTATQVFKVVVGVLAISWSLVTYQDELRRTSPGREKLTCCAVTTCFLWRLSMVTSRVLAIGSFASIYAPEGVRNALTVHLREDGSVHLPFPIVAACVLAAHWLIMVAWIHAQGTNFCSTSDGMEGGNMNKRRSVLEFLFNCVMGVVHIFSYVNTKDTPSRRRMSFFYAFCLIENTAMISVWCVEMEPHLKVWFRAIMVFGVELLWVLGICCVTGYYAFLHPGERENGGGGTARNHQQQHASWRT